MSLLKGKISNILKAKQRLRHYYSNTIDIDTAKITSNALDEEFMSKAIQIVEENIDDENFTADDLAEKLCDEPFFLVPQDELDIRGTAGGANPIPSYPF